MLAGHVEAGESHAQRGSVAPIRWVDRVVGNQGHCRRVIATEVTLVEGTTLARVGGQWGRRDLCRSVFEGFRGYGRFVECMFCLGAKVLIGHFLQVTTTSGSDALTLMTSLGADAAVDYKEEGARELLRKHSP
jgi:hypothetical protein